jgi:pimeloyl-ACP methyl ester carboxylesterase
MLTFVAAGANVWGKSLQLFEKHSVLKLEGESVDEMLRNLKNQVPEKANIVAHDLAGLVALLLACEAPERVRSVSAVSSVAAAPTGDSMVNLTLAHPPARGLKNEAARWALERISYSHHHIDDALLEDYAQASKKPRPEDLPAAKAKLYEACRTRGFPVPAQVIWGTHDPLGSLEQGMWLYRILAARQKAVHFHAINRAGALPFREEPEAFHQVVSAFVEGIA